MYRTQQKHVCSVPLCYWYYARVSNFLYISATIGLSKTSHWCIPTCFSRNIISSRHPKGNYILEQKPNFYATFLRSYRTKTDISCLSRANMAKITPDLAKSDKRVQTHRRHRQKQSRHLKQVPLQLKHLKQNLQELITLRLLRQIYLTLILKLQG